MAAGYVYILINHSMPGMIKIGRTLRDCNARARELQSTGVPTPFVVAFEKFADAHEDLEAQLFKELDEFRVSGNREFFRYPLHKAISLLESLSRNPKDVSASYVAESIFSQLQEQYKIWLRPEIVDVRIVQTHERVWLEITEEKVITERRINQIIRRTDLGFCCLGDKDYFKVSDPVSLNAEKFVDWCPYSIMMTIDLFHDEACRYIDSSPEFNPHL